MHIYIVDINSFDTLVLVSSTTYKKSTLKKEKMVWESQSLWTSSKYLDFALGIMYTPHLLIENEWNDGKGIDGFAMP